MGNQPFSTSSSNDYQFDTPPMPDFGNSQGYQETKRRGGGGCLGFMGGATAIGCFAVVGLIALCCCLCVGAVVVAARSSQGAITLWVTGGTGGDWSLSQNFVCDGSQAETLTNQYDLAGRSVTSFNLSANAGEKTTVTAVMEMNGRTGNWEATFTVGDGGAFGRCIENIDVTLDELGSSGQ